MIGQTPDFPGNQGFPDSNIDPSSISSQDQPDDQPFESGIQFRGGGSGHYDREREAEALTDLRNTIRDYLIAAFTKEDLGRVFLYSSDPEMRAIRDQIAKSSGIAGAADVTIEHSLARGIDLTTRVIEATAAANPRRYQQYKPLLDAGLEKARQVTPEKVESETPSAVEDEQHQLADVIRQFLQAGFGDDDLRRLLVYSRDPQVAALQHDTTIDVGKTGNLDRIVELARAKNILPNLAVEAARTNPRMYALFEGAIRAELAKLGEQQRHSERPPVQQRRPAAPARPAYTSPPPQPQPTRPRPTAAEQPPHRITEAEQIDREADRAARLIEEMERERRTQVTERPVAVEAEPTEPVTLADGWRDPRTGQINPPYREMRQFFETQFQESDDPDSDTRRFIKLLMDDPNFQEIRYRIGLNSDMGDVVDEAFELARTRLKWQELMNLAARVKPQELEDAQDGLRIRVNQALVEPMEMPSAPSQKARPETTYPKEELPQMT
ncbi:MAG: hypothetical protein PHG63_00245, partial [Candidatus Dojkabacteria bacterium]|nr:hypothetical protein [Candidatus Dojkabacteria bacterium]